MDLRHVRYFLAVAEEGHFTRAAAKVGIGQPPLSAQIRDLEREIGAALFKRTPQGAELTSAGLAFLTNVRDLPDLLDRATGAARRAARGESGEIRVGVTASAALNPIVAGTIQQFIRSHSGVDLQFVETNTTFLASGLTEGSLDVVFLRPGIAENEQFQVRVLAEEPLVAVLPKDHLCATQREVKLADLRDDPFLLFPREIGLTLYDTIIDACRTAGFEPMLGQLVPTLAGVVILASAGLGVSLVPASLTSLGVSGATFLPLADVHPIARVALAYRRGGISPMVRNFLACAHA